MHNKQRNRKAFTIVELVIVIAVIAVLAAVMIPTFAGLIEQAEYSAYLQERTNQLIQDMIEKSKDPDYFTWEDFEDRLNDYFKDDDTDSLTKEEILNLIMMAIDRYNKEDNNDNTGLTPDQIQAIIQQILKDQGFGDTLTKEEIKDIIEDILDRNETVTIVTCDHGQEKWSNGTCTECGAKHYVCSYCGDQFVNPMNIKHLKVLGTEDTYYCFACNADLTGAGKLTLCAATECDKCGKTNNGGTGDDNQGGNGGSGDDNQGGNGGSGDDNQGGNGGSGDDNQGGNTECRHSELVSLKDNQDGTHTGTCFACGKSVTAEHFYKDGICACAVLKIYQYQCSSACNFSASVKIDAEGQGWYLKGDVWLKLEKDEQATDSASYSHLYHFDCPAINGAGPCPSCFVRVDYCDHDKTYSETGNKYTHTITCSECNESYKVKHSFNSQGNCVCGAHQHNFICYQEIEGELVSVYGKHEGGAPVVVMCSYSECNATQTQYYTYYNVNDTRHTPKCSNCGTLNAQDHKMVESECACGYFDCGCADLTVSPGDAGGHWLSCKEHGRVYIAHTNTGSTNNGKCECGDFIIHSSTDTTNTNNGRFLNTIANMGDSFRLYVCADDKIFNNTSIRQAAVIDLCNRTVKNETSSGKMFTIGTSGVVIKDGKVELKKVNNNFIVVSANAGVTIEDIDITTFGNQSRTVITANAGCEITLKNVTVNGILITEENVATYINGAANATIRIENTTN